MPRRRLRSIKRAGVDEEPTNRGELRIGDSGKDHGDLTPGGEARGKKGSTVDLANEKNSGLSQSAEYLS